MHVLRDRPIRTACVSLLAAAVWMILVPASAGAFPLTDEQIKCSSGFIKSSSKVMDTVGKMARTCQLAIGKEGGGGDNDISDCILADTQQKLAKAHARVNSSIDKFCSIPYPMTCPQPCDTVDDGGATTDIDDDPELQACLQCFNIGMSWSGSIVSPLLQGALGSFLKGATVPADPAALKCQNKIILYATRVFQAKTRSAAKCIRAQFIAGALAPPVNCIANLDTDAKVQTTIAKLDGVIQSCTPPAPFDAADCSGLSGTALTDCIDRNLECRACRWINGVIGGTFDCDTFDNGVADASCLTP